MSKTKVLFVCLGNICRSPLAEGIFRHKLSQQGLTDQVEVDSCGTAAYHIGEHPDSRSMENARMNGVVYDHLGRQLIRQDFYDFDLIIPMDQSNWRDVQNLKPKDATAQVIMMRDFDDLDKGANVPDPYYGGEQGFQQVFDILSRSTSNLIDYINQ